MCTDMYKLRRYINQKIDELNSELEYYLKTQEILNEFEKKNLGQLLLPDFDVSLVVANKPSEDVIIESPTQALRRFFEQDSNKEWLYVELEAEIEDMIASNRLKYRKGRKVSNIVYSALYTMVKNGEIVKHKNIKGRTSYTKAT